MRYVYEGPGPIERDGEIIRPGDVLEFDGEPDWGPFEPAADDGPVRPPEPPAAPSPGPAPDRPPAPAVASPAGTPAPEPDGGK